MGDAVSNRVFVINPMYLKRCIKNQKFFFDKVEGDANFSGNSENDFLIFKSSLKLNL
jgi:hypothetical protein